MLMNKQIAVLVNDSGKITSFLESGVVNIYVKENESWNIKDKIIFDTDSISDINLLRSNITKLAEHLGECKIFVAERVAGIPYNILEKFGINSWEINGDPYKCLDYVLEKEQEEEKRILIEANKPKHDSEKWILKDDESCNYSLDLVEMQNKSPNVTTKQVLLPFFKNTAFSKLTIDCSHIPKWFEGEIDRFNLKFNVQKLGINKFKVIVTPK